MATKRRGFRLSDFIGGDRTLWIIILVLCIFSILVIYSSTGSLAYKKYDGDTNVYLIRQLKYTCLGLVVAVVVHWIDYKYFLRYGIWLYFFASVLMLMTFTKGDSVAELNDASRWIRYGGLTFQPADLLKVTTVMMLARALSRRQHIIDKIEVLPSLLSFGNRKSKSKRNRAIFLNNTIPILLPVAFAMFLVMFSSLSTALIIGGTCFMVLVIGRVRLYELFSMIGYAMVMLIVAFLFMKVTGTGRAETWESRISTFVSGAETPKASNHEMDPGEYQKHQALIAVASGWLTGKGPGNSTQRSNLPHPYSDYAYAFIIEEYGIIVAILLLGCYLWIFSRSIVIFRRCEAPYPSLLVLGLGLLISLQAFLHMMVTVGYGPVTGQPLPIISLGGSSLIFTCFTLGVMQSVARVENKKEHLRRLERERKLVVEEWSHVVVSEKEIDKIESGNKQPEKYNGVIWNGKDKSDS